MQKLDAFTAWSKARLEAYQAKDAIGQRIAEASEEYVKLNDRRRLLQAKLTERLSKQH